MHTPLNAQIHELSEKLANKEVPPEETAHWLAMLEKQVPHPTVAGCVLWSDEEDNFN